VVYLSATLVAPSLIHGVGCFPQGEPIEKNVFAIFAQGPRALHKCRKICEAFGAHIYPISLSIAERQQLRQELTSRMSDLSAVIARGRERVTAVLEELSMVLPEWHEVLIKEKAIYHTMNLFNYDIGRQCLIAEAWCPSYAVQDILIALRRANV